MDAAFTDGADGPDAAVNFVAAGRALRMVDAAAGASLAQFSAAVAGGGPEAQ
jgi:hypothetical protein